MNDYGFDYMNYITNIPNNMIYGQNNTNYGQTQKMNMNYDHIQKMNMNYMMNNQNMSSMMSKQQTLEPTQGWMKGNLFANQYEPYKNYKPVEINPQNERDTLMYQLMQYKFALIELNLYLDTHPNDSEMIKLYNQYLNNEKQMSDKYESKYGPITLGSNYLNKNTWVWNDSPWPWEGV